MLRPDILNLNLYVIDVSYAFNFVILWFMLERKDANLLDLVPGNIPETCLLKIDKPPCSVHQVSHYLSTLA